MEKSWTVTLDKQQHVVNLKSGFSGRGEISVDGKVVATWKSGFSSLPAKTDFKIAGKPATIKRSGFVSQKADLLVDGQLVKST